uniref:Inorganic phosphate transporter n=1 Tax=Rhodosorus marinus TaxID=101924 RepID=A0A7S2ZG36_9RHOD|mmetsp:Transcript_18485/g.74291  ORF Transcript_18485/g.74291 Transcript_18485/m.74291 type:complete len:150 (+) Transcript_18485:359-808(+)
MAGLGSPQVRNLVIFLSLLYGMRQVDQNDPIAINYCRMVFALYLLIGIAFQGYVTKIINDKKDTREIEVPPQPALGAAPGPPEKKTVMEYDLGQLSTQRTQMLLNSLMVAFFHFKMGQVSPLVMTSVMGIMRFLDDPMVRKHHGVWEDS